jgi:hypothetical protein
MHGPFTHLDRLIAPKFLRAQCAVHSASCPVQVALRRVGAVATPRTQAASQRFSRLARVKRLQELWHKISWGLRCEFLENSPWWHEKGKGSDPVYNPVAALLHLYLYIYMA